MQSKEGGKKKSRITIALIITVVLITYLVFSTIYIAIVAAFIKISHGCTCMLSRDIEDASLID